MGRFEPGSTQPGSLEGERIEDEDIVAVDFMGAVLRHTTWTNCHFDNQGMDGVIFRNADLTGATFEDCELEILHAEGVKANGVTFRRCTFGYASFSESELEGAVFEDVHAENGLYFTGSKCRGMKLTVVAEATYEPETIDLVGADLRGASLSARLSENEAARIRELEFRDMKWSEFTIQKAKTDEDTRFEYGELPFDHEPKKAKPKRKLGKRTAVLAHDEWGTIASIAVVGDRVYTGEGGWSGDASRYGAKGHFRVAAWHEGERLWETKLLAGSGTDDVDVIADDAKVYAIASDTAFVLDAGSGEVLSSEEVGSANWVAPGVVGLYKVDHAIIRALGAKAGTEHEGRWIECASADGSLFWSQLDYDQDASDWIWVIRTRDDGRVVTRTGNHTSSCFSGDGRRHASAWKKESIEIRDARSGEPVKSFDPAPSKKRKPEVRSLAMSHDGKWLAGAAGATQVVVWDAETGEECVKHSKLEPPIEAIAFSADAKSLYVGTGLAKEDRCVSVFPL